MLPATFAIVSSAPYSLPPASQVCCMRLSLESSGPSTSRTGEGPMPSRQTVMMQSRSGPRGAVAEHQVLELDHGDGGGAGGQGGVGEGVQLGAVEVVAEHCWPGSGPASRPSSSP